MYYFVEVACVIAEIWMIHMFLGSLFNKRGASLLQRIILYGVFGGIITVLSLQEDMAFARLGVAFVGVWAVSMLIFDARMLQGVLSGVAFCAIVAVTDVGSAIAFQSCGVDSSALMANYASRALYLVANHILLFGIVIIICVINRKSHSRMSIKILLPVLPCWIISILLCFLFAWQCFVKDFEWHPLFLIVLLGLLYTNIIMIYFTNKTSEQAQIKKDFEIAEHHYAMQQEYYDQLRVQQEETRALWHDISKYLRAAQVDSTSVALTEVQEMLDSISCVVDVNNRIVSVILNEYFQIAKNSGIEVEIDVQVPSELFVTAADLYVLIGNTLDNAIEACVALPEEQRKINLKLKKHNNILFYEVSNPYTEKHLRRVRGNYHGFGLKNVARCVEKYNGKLDITKKNGVFRVVAHLNSL
ncbi:MAG: GHKL domain-containing protein [Oscillospiraceae bacterium]|nr:GHKL domain-containing protein [Oscillospiraceae bacterium]